MTQATEQKIRERAYEIWMATGCENGLADLHWLSAEQAVMDEAAQPGAKVAGQTKKTARPRAAKPKGFAAALPATVAVRKRAGTEKVGRA